MLFGMCFIQELRERKRAKVEREIEMFSRSTFQHSSMQNEFVYKLPLLAVAKLLAVITTAPDSAAGHTGKRRGNVPSPARRP